jgi:hypothetical protein
MGLATPAAGAGPVIQLRDDVVVEADGNGVLMTEFPTTLGGDGVRYVLGIDNGCRADRPRCKYPTVEWLHVTLNGYTVYDAAPLDDHARVDVALVPAANATPNTLIVIAAGPPSASARIVFAAIEPPQRHIGGRAVLPYGDVASVLALHNPGSAPLACRLLFYLPDGSEAGRSPALLLGPHAVERVDLATAANALGWTAGAVHVLWGSLRDTRLSAVASSDVSTSARLALDDLGPFPLDQVQFDDVTGGLLEAGAP